ncbi:MAG: SDR family oxidoreductase [Verrucomicrobiae bacterium]|nr:SDR family oxidoreductase [Verrucomicrobiae bacterium]
MDAATSAVWITGAGGLIGSHLARLAARALPGRRILPLARPDLDLTDTGAVARRFQQDQPGIVLHCAALSRSPACQADPARARELNVEVPRRLIRLSAELLFVFFSTDLVFDGTTGNYREEDTPRPLLVYGETKAAAEAIVQTHPAHLVIRTSVNAGDSPTGDRGFDEELRNAWKSGREVPLFDDEFRAPIAAPETARAVLDLVRAGARGIYHVAGSERMSRWEMGDLLAARHPDLQPRIRRTSLKNFQGFPRPADVTLDVSKVAAAVGRPMPRFRDWLAAQPRPGSGAG